MTHSDAFATDVWDFLAGDPGDVTELRASAVRAIFSTRRPIPRTERTAALRQLAFDTLEWCDNPTAEALQEIRRSSSRYEQLRRQ